MSDLIATVREALAKATIGPWTALHCPGHTHQVIKCLSLRVAKIYARYPADADRAAADANLIAHAPLWLSALCDALGRLEAQIAEAQLAYSICPAHTPDRWMGDGTCVVCEGNSLNDQLAEAQRERDEAEATVTRLREALEAVEWVAHPTSRGRLLCPWCGHHAKDGHATHCQRRCALAASPAPQTASDELDPVACRNRSRMEQDRKDREAPPAPQTTQYPEERMGLSGNMIVLSKSLAPLTDDTKGGGK